LIFIRIWNHIPLLEGPSRNGKNSKKRSIVHATNIKSLLVTFTGKLTLGPNLLPCS